MRGGRGCSRCEDSGGLGDMRGQEGDTGVWGLGEIRHIFSVTFLFIIYDLELKGGREACVVSEALYMEEAEAHVAGLLVLCPSIKLSITIGALKVHSSYICTILMGEGGWRVQR